MDYRCEIVTPSGRRKYLELLYKNLKLQKDHFNIWQLWINTKNKEDIEYMKNLEKENDWIQCIESKINIDGRNSISHFFNNTTREDTIYIFFDDDIVYLSENFILELKDLRIKNTDNIFISPSIINNGLLSYIYFKNGLIKFEKSPKYYFLDDISWGNPYFCENLHNSFINDIGKNDIKKWKEAFNKWILTEYERFSLDCFAFFGSVIKHEIRKIDCIDFENDLTSVITKKFNNPIAIYGSPICVHYSFGPQRSYLETNTNIYDKYKEIADKN